MKKMPTGLTHKLRVMGYLVKGKKHELSDIQISDYSTAILKELEFLRLVTSSTTIQCLFMTNFIQFLS